MSILSDKLTAKADWFKDKMYAVMDTNFRDWLIGKLNAKEWSQSELARKADLSRQAISDYINERRNPDNDALKKIARAFGIKEEIVFRAAGVLSNNKDIDEDFEQLKYLFTQMTDEEQLEFLAMGRLKIELRNKRVDVHDTPSARAVRVRT